MGRRAWLVLPAVLAGLLLLGGSGQAGPPAAGRPRVLFFGDSLIAGTGAVSRRPVMVQTAADRLGWSPVVDAYGGTGYTTGGPAGRPYLSRLRSDGYLHAERYGIVVLEGGTNDAHHGSLSRLRATALRVLDVVRRAQPQARLVMLGVYAPPGVPLARYLEADRLLQEAAADRGVTYVTQLHWAFTPPRGFLSRDHFHPSDLGYGVMGRELAGELNGSRRTPSEAAEESVGAEGIEPPTTRL